MAGCVHTDSDRENCGGCGQRCPELYYCVVGVCRNSSGTLEIDPEEPEVVVDVEPGPAGHPQVAWNWARRNHWFSWSWERHGDWFTSWYQFFFWELDYGIAWVQQTPSGDGLLLFNGRHFVTSWINPIGEVAGSVSSFLDELRGLTWYGNRIVAFLDGEDTIPCLAPAGGLGYGLVWSDGSGGSTQIHFAAIGQYGGLTGWHQPITFGPGDRYYPRIAWGPYYYFMGSNYGLVYQLELDDDVQIYFQQVQGYVDWYTPFGGAWRVSNNEGGAINPNIAWSPLGYGVVYIGAEDSNLYFSLVGGFGHTLIPPTQITTEENVAAMRPAIAWNGADGEFGIAFQATSPPSDNQDIYFMRVTPYGSALGAPVRLTSDVQLQRAPDMAWAGDSYGITYYDRATLENEIALVIVDPQGTIIDGPIAITDHGGNGNAANPAITYASMTDVIDGQTFGLFGWLGGDQLGTGEYALVWRDEPTEGADPEVHFLRLTETE